MSDRQSDQNAREHQISRVIEVKWAYRWEVYRRLKALEIDCQCATNEPLLVDLHSPTVLVQIWSVLRQAHLVRDRELNWLNNCWSVEYDLESKHNPSK